MKREWSPRMRGLMVELLKGFESRTSTDLEVAAELGLAFVAACRIAEVDSHVVVETAAKSLDDGLDYHA